MKNNIKVKVIISDDNKPKKVKQNIFEKNILSNSSILKFHYEMFINRKSYLSNQNFSKKYLRFFIKNFRHDEFLNKFEKKLNDYLNILRIPNLDLNNISKSKNLDDKNVFEFIIDMLHEVIENGLSIYFRLYQENTNNGKIKINEFNKNYFFLLENDIDFTFTKYKKNFNNIKNVFYKENEELLKKGKQFYKKGLSNNRKKIYSKIFKRYDEEYKKKGYRPKWSDIIKWTKNEKDKNGYPLVSDEKEKKDIYKSFMFYRNKYNLNSYQDFLNHFNK